MKSFIRMLKSIPEYIWHYASAMFVNGSFWDDQTKLIQELKMEGHQQYYIDSYMSHMKMLKSTYNLVTKGKTFSLTPTYKLIISISSFIFLHCTYSIFNILSTITFSNIKKKKKDKNSFSFVISGIFLLLTFTLSLILFIDSILLNIFVGVLRDMTMPHQVARYHRLKIGSSNTYVI